MPTSARIATALLMTSIVLLLSEEGTSFAQIPDAPAEFEPSADLVPVESRVASTPEARLIERALLDLPSDMPASESITLDELLDGVTDEPRRREMIRAYWELSLALAADSHAEKERTWIEQLVDESTVKDASLTSSLARASARQQEARLRSIDAQHRLSQLLQHSPEQRLPHPADLPVTGPYQTYFNELYVRRDVARNEQLAARRIHKTLPLVQEVIRARATSVIAAEQLFKAHEAGGQVGKRELIAAWDRITIERHAFLTAVLEYNLSIGDYAVRVAAGNRDNAMLISMLLPSSPSKSDVVPTSGSELVDEPPADLIQPQETEPRELPQAPSRQIRSILVPSSSDPSLRL